jgi:hypothetical protein
MFGFHFSQSGELFCSDSARAHTSAPQTEACLAAPLTVQCEGENFEMSLSKSTMLVMGLAAIGLVSGAATLAVAQAPSKDVISKLDNNQGIFVDKNSYDVVKGNAKTDNPLKRRSSHK